MNRSEAAGGDGAAEKQPLVKVGPDTTVLTEPLDEEGYVDFQAHANAVLSKGVTPDNNAAVLLWKASGPANIGEEHRAEYFKRLGIEPLPDEGDYFREYEEFADKEKPDEIYEQVDAAASRPGRRTNSPRWHAGWPPMRNRWPSPLRPARGRNCISR